MLNRPADLAPPPLSWCKIAARDAARSHKNWPLRALAVEGYRVAFGWMHPNFHGVLIMPSVDD